MHPLGNISLLNEGEGLPWDARQHIYAVLYHGFCPKGVSQMGAMSMAYHNKEFFSPPNAPKTKTINGIMESCYKSLLENAELTKKNK